MKNDGIVSEEKVYECLREVIDPELNVNIVDLGLIYEVEVTGAREGSRVKIKILMTLTTPGCPLAGVINTMVKESLRPLGGFDVDEDVEIEVTFDPPWVPEMMTDEVRAELGLDEW